MLMMPQLHVVLTNLYVKHGDLEGAVFDNPRMYLDARICAAPRD
jgi:hypothetical protein